MTEKILLDRLLNRAAHREAGVPEHDLPPVPADLLQPADWNLLEPPRVHTHLTPWPEPDCPECRRHIPTTDDRTTRKEPQP